MIAYLPGWVPCQIGTHNVRGVRERFTMQWFALRVKPRHERAVIERLKVKSIEGYLPLYLSERRWSDRTKTIGLPLFPSYVFSQFRIEERQKVLTILSVTSIVSFGGLPCAVSEEEMATVKALIASGFPIAPTLPVCVGQKVRVVQGVLRGLEGIVEREKSDCRVIVNMDLLQRAVAVEVDRNLLVPMGGPEANN